MAWLLLRNASVLSLEDKILTLRFPRDGDLKGFTISGHDADLKRVLSTGFGLNVTVKGVTGVDPQARAEHPFRPGRDDQGRDRCRPGCRRGPVRRAGQSRSGRGGRDERPGRGHPGPVPAAPR